MGPLHKASFKETHVHNMKAKMSGLKAVLSVNGHGVDDVIFTFLM